MQRNGTVSFVAAAVLAVSLLASLFLTNAIAASAGRHQLAYTDAAEQGLTRAEAVAVTLGAFRGLVVNWLWMRANDLKQEGKHHEAVDLARTITKLQPRFPRVWVFHAWNLAYNISVATQTREERWKWVNAGIRLLRDEGIPANPNDLLLHRELAWILLHKVQGYMDDANQYYKTQFALEWTIALGTPPQRGPESRTPEAAKALYARWMAEVADAPSSLEDLYAAEPAARELVAAIGARTDRQGRSYDLTRLDDIWRLREFIEVQRAEGRRMEGMGVGIQPDEAAAGLLALLTEPRFVAPRRLLDRHMRRRLVEERYNMEPGRMVRYIEKFGPLDWRHPAAHSLYWSARGVEETLGRLTERTAQNADFINTDRITVQSVQELYRSGTILFDILTPSDYLAVNNLDFVPMYRAQIDEVIEREAQQFLVQRGVDVRERVWGFYRAGYENFMTDAIVLLYRRGDIDRAQQYKSDLYHWKDRVQNDWGKSEEYLASLEDFVIKQMNDRITSPNVAVQEIYGALQSAFIHGLLAGDEQVFRANFSYAQRFHAAFMKEQYRLTPAGGDRQRMEVVPRDFGQAAAEMLRHILIGTGMPMTDAALVFRRTPDDLRVRVWDVMDLQNRPRDDKGAPIASIFDLVFPKPPGVDAFRAARQAAQPPGVERGKIELK